ncbi:restriction endonuclease subunit S [Tenacibaculum aestuarii]|uniref:restriction endonuclease subunit S n=1 Tax=Tenacibaculum aestuarii TaxID=362781 RepID=UPI003896272D
MSNSWKEFTIEEIGDVIGGGTPSTKNPDYWEGDISWITPKDLSGYKYKRISKGERNITELGLTKSSAKLLPKNTVLITSRAPIGYVAIADNEVTTNQGFKSIVLKDGFDSDYVYYLIKSNVRLLESVSSGSTFKEISGNELKKLRFNFPELSQQKAIAYILGTLDDKIELNRKMNETLEQMAQALFKSWFVNFDPVLDNALAKGNKMPEVLKHKVEQRKEVISSGKYKALPKELMELFPSSFEYHDELDKWIPEGWDVSTVSDLADVVGGGTPSTKVEEYYCENGIPWLSPKDLSGYDWRYISKGAKDITELGLKKSSAKLMPKGTVLFSSRAPIGYVAIAENEVSTNQGFKSLVPKSGVPSEFLFQLLKANVSAIEAIASGSTFKEVSGTAIKDFTILNPPKEILDKYELITKKWNHRFIQLQKETDSLVKQREVLLPQLISGKLRLKN